MARIRIDQIGTAPGMIQPKQIVGFAGSPLLPYFEGQYSRDQGALMSCLTAANRLSISGGDTMRRQDRGVGKGSNFFCEPTRVNYAKQTVFFPAPWAVANGAVLTAQATIGVDAYNAHLASSIAFPASSIAFIGQTLATNVVPANTRLTFSVWAKNSSGNGSFKFQCVDLDGTTRTSGIMTAGTFWQRFEFSLDAGTTVGGTFVIRLLNGDATARTIFFQFPMLEPSTEATSYIHNDTTGNGFSAPDILQFIPGQVPYQLRALPHVGWLYPARSSANMILNGDRLIARAHVGRDDTLELTVTGGQVKLLALTGGVVQAASQALVFNQWDELAYLNNPPGGVITVNGVAGPAGTPWVWPAGVVRIGGGVGGDGSFTFRGEIKQEYAA